MSEELLPCPFCGSDAEFDYEDWDPETGEGDDGTGRAHCVNPRCDVGFFDEPDSAIDQWNARSSRIGWISVESRFPDEGQDVNFVTKEGRVLGGRFILVGGFQPKFSVSGMNYAAKWWRPAPEPPKEAGE